jgi:N-acetylglucosaminyldiphosphoundecaprenol N-acetyl-beta-D-mannosaminyltransferase
MLAWIRAAERARYVAVTGMHGVSEAQQSSAVRDALEAADLVVPDGMPLVWLGRMRGHALRRRVYGPELMETFCRETAAEGYRHYFYGGAPGVAEDLAGRFERRFPGLQVAGWYAPPFRELTDDERHEVCARINAARPDVLWVGLSTPRQELWMHRNRDLLKVPVMVGVGAAFDIHTGRVRQAPRWMRESGLEWSWRLMHEPRRLWRRYLLNGPRFVFGVAVELAKTRWRRT